MARSIVIVDDDPDIIELLSYSFRKTGITIYPFQSSKDAFHFISSYKPDLIISDWMMPELDGIQLCNLLSVDPRLKLIPFVFLTCKDEIKDKEAAWQAGASEFISKPVRITELMEKVNNMLA